MIERNSILNDREAGYVVLCTDRVIRKYETRRGGGGLGKLQPPQSVFSCMGRFYFKTRQYDRPARLDLMY